MTINSFSKVTKYQVLRLETHAPFLLLSLSLFAISSYAQKFTINGYVKDAGNGEELIGVTVLVVGTSTGTTTNAYGFYSITLPAGSHQLQFSYVGYRSFSQTFELRSNLVQNVELATEATTIQEVIVTLNGSTPM